MADEKKYYYMRLKENFFDSEQMIVLESMQDGVLYSNILLKMYLKSLKYNGKLMLAEYIPYSPQMIATITRHQVGTVERALRIFRELGLIEVLDNGAIFMADIQNYIGKGSSEADRIRAYRKRIEEEKMLLENTDVTNVRTNVRKNYPKIEIESEIEKEIEKELELELEYNSLVHSDEMHALENLPKVQNSVDDSKLPQEQKLASKSKTSKPSKAEIEAVFEDLWKLYPVKRGKGSISYTTKLKVYGVREQIPRCIERYVDDTKKRFGHREGGYQRWLKNGSTFFNSGYVDYLDENYEELQGTGDTGGKKGFTESTLEEFEREMRMARQ